MYLFDLTSQTFSDPTSGNRPMLNSDLDLDPTPNPIARSIPLTARPIVPELSIDSLDRSQCYRSISMPIFDEATELVARSTAAPVAILTTISGAGYRIGALYGADKFTQLATTANLYTELSGLEYCHDRTINSGDCCSVTNFRAEPQLAQSQIYCSHRIQAYLGVPIFTAARDLFGTLAILDFCPRQFDDREIGILQSIARLVASEFERKRLSQAQLDRWVGELRYAESAVRGFDDLAATVEHERNDPARRAGGGDLDRMGTDRDRVTTTENCPQNFIQVRGEIQLQLLTHLAQELRTPLTAVLGMSSVLQQEIYGSLSSKQKDYLSIIHHSGEQLVTIVNEISQIGGFIGSTEEPERQLHRLTLKSVDLEMLCQLALQSLEPLTQKKHQQSILNLVGGSEAAGDRTWLLDKDKVRQIVYYLSLSLIDRSAPHQRISIQRVNLADGLQLQLFTSDKRVILDDFQSIDATPRFARSIDDADVGQELRIRLGLSLSQALAIAHGGNIEVTTDRRGYRLNLPLIATTVGST